MPQRLLFVSCVATLVAFLAATHVVAGEFRVATFSVDVTIPLNHRCMGVLPTKSKRIRDPLEVKGLILLGAKKPVVVCAVDWCEIRNGAYDAWRDAIAAAVATERQRVLVSCLHQHDAPVIDSGAAKILRDAGLPNELYDEQFHTKTVARVAAAARAAIADAKPINRIGTGQARVDRIASNRRVIDNDGRVSFGRGSRSGGSALHSGAAEGEIDPILRTVSFWMDEEPIAALSVYATHPMSHYGRGEVSADFVGLARRRMQQENPEVMQIYASGCSGDVTAGKYNDGSEESRQGLIRRLYDAMKSAWDSTETQPLSRINFLSTPLNLEFYGHRDLEPKRLRKIVGDDSVSTEARILAAMGLSSHQRVQAGIPIDFPCVDFGNVKLLLFPAESFVGYQLMAQAMSPDAFVVSMGYGECWPGYIPMNDSFADHFHDNWLWVPPGSENRIQRALQTVLTP